MTQIKAYLMEKKNIATNCSQVTVPVLAEYYSKWGYQHNFHFYGFIDPLECIFMAPLALFNEGATNTLFSPYGGTHDEAPERKKLLRWPSRMQIYSFLKWNIFQCDGTI